MDTNPDLTKYIKIAKDIRRYIVKMHAASDTSHIGSSLSCVDILVSLYFSILRINPSNPNDKNRDRFILSKGHAASALYATMAKRGFMNSRLLNQYCCDGSSLPGHSTKDCVPGVEVSAGSLGHGLAIGAGMALAEKHDNLGYRVFVLLSDGECDEGSTWEAALFISHHKMDNVVAIVDRNKIQAFGRTEEVLSLEPFAEKWKAFGWEVREVDGHSFKQIISALEKVPFEKNRPSLIIAHTVKGKGISFMENKIAWHYKAPKENELKMAMGELNPL